MESARIERSEKLKQARAAYEQKDLAKGASQGYSIMDMLANIRSKATKQPGLRQISHEPDQEEQRHQHQRKGVHTSDPIEDFGPHSQAVQSGAHQRKLSPHGTPTRHSTSSVHEGSSSTLPQSNATENQPGVLSDDTSSDEQKSKRETVGARRQREEAERKREEQEAAEKFEEQKRLAAEHRRKRKEAMMEKQALKDNQRLMADGALIKPEPSSDPSAAHKALTGSRALDLKQMSSPKSKHDAQHARSPVDASQGARKADADHSLGVRKVLFKEELETPAERSSPVPEPAPQHQTRPKKGQTVLKSSVELNMQMRLKMRLQNREQREKLIARAKAKGIKGYSSYDPNERTVHATLLEMETAQEAAQAVGSASDQEEEEDSDYVAGSDAEQEGSVSDEEPHRALHDDKEEQQPAEQDEQEEEQQSDVGYEASDKENDPPPGSLPGSQHSYSAVQDLEDGNPAVHAHRKRQAIVSDSSEDDAEGPPSSQRSRARSVLGPLEVDEQDQPEEDEDMREALDTKHKSVSSSQLMPPPTIPSFKVKSSTSTVGPASDADDVLGQFFADTQSQVQPSEAFPNLHKENPPSVLGSIAPGGFSQFFVETQEKTTGPEADADDDSDAFAALRNNQEGLANLPTEDFLPSINEAEAERYEAEADEAEERHVREQRRALLETPKQYMNKHGLYTQTKPSQTVESQSQDWLGATPQQGFFESMDERDSMTLDAYSKTTPTQPPKRRFRLGQRQSPQHSPEIGGEEKIVVKAASQSGEDSEEEAAESEEVHALVQELPKPKQRTAFDAMMKAAKTQPPRHEDVQATRKKKSAYVEGEAEEDSDDDGPVFEKKNDKMRGVFSDEEDQPGEGDEDESEDGDARDVEGLVDDIKELDEAAKDKLMRKKAAEQAAEDDAVLQRKVQKITEGKWRNMRRGANGLDDALDEDADDADDLRRLQMPAALREQKRNLEGDDDLEALSECHRHWGIVLKIFAHSLFPFSLQRTWMAPKHSSKTTR